MVRSLETPPNIHPMRNKRKKRNIFVFNKTLRNKCEISGYPPIENKGLAGTATAQKGMKVWRRKSESGGLFTPFLRAFCALISLSLSLSISLSIYLSIYKIQRTLEKNTPLFRLFRTPVTLLEKPISGMY